ncbi:hypothetical protein FGO68_gene6256 [Halteria grandinella]|uniref:C2 domain-containing protein n=1 Tax=Halteria grandinella TaxID=5974 RepID=A0A8J8T4H1_HALGN|nr:hypothetical protein FGO68_gene6256 [Halteria grandinella]
MASILNPFVVFECNGAHIESPICPRGGVRPIWNETLSPIQIILQNTSEENDMIGGLSSPPLPPTNEVLHIQMLDKGDLHMGNTLIGETTIQVASLIIQSKETGFVEKWIPLQIASRITCEIQIRAIISDSRSSVQPTPQKELLQKIGQTRGARAMGDKNPSMPILAQQQTTSQS